MCPGRPCAAGLPSLTQDTPRQDLEKCRVKYCGVLERKRFEVVVREGHLVYKEVGAQSGL